MGVEFLICRICNDTFPDCGEFSHCAGCRKNFCKYCAKDFVFESYEEPEKGEPVPEVTCPVCTMQHISDKELLAFVIETKLGVTRDSLEADYRSAKKKE